MMWPWRVQTTEGATGSAFAIAFANSYGQIGGAVGSQLFNSRYAPKYTTSFGIAMGFIGAAIVMNLITWGFTYRVDVDTRKIKRARLAAAKRNQAVLDDVDIHAGQRSQKRVGTRFLLPRCQCRRPGHIYQSGHSSCDIRERICLCCYRREPRKFASMYSLRASEVEPWPIVPSSAYGTEQSWMMISTMNG